MRVLYLLVIEHFGEMWTIVATFLSFAVSLVAAWFAEPPADDRVHHG
ncbi:hypothetical protein ACUTJJ_22580 [Agrobacterium sp. DKPNP3]